MLLSGKILDILQVQVTSSKLFRSALIRLINPSQFDGHHFCTLPRKKYGPYLYPDRKPNAIRLAELIGVSVENATRIISRLPKCFHYVEGNVPKLLEIIRKYNLPERSIEQQPRLLTFGVKTLENEILICQETGIRSKAPFLLLHNCFAEIKKRSILRIKNSDLIDAKRNVVEEYGKILRLTKDEMIGLYSNLPENPEELALQELRNIVISYYLSIQLAITIPQAETFLSGSRSTIKRRSLVWIRDILDILVNQCELSAEQILKNKKILGACPTNALEVLKVGHAVDVSIKKMIQIKPSLILEDASMMQEMVKLIKDHGFDITAVEKFPYIFMLCKKCVDKRIKEMNKIPQLNVLRDHPLAMHLLYLQAGCKKRLKQAKDRDMSVPGPSANLLIASRVHYNNFLNFGYRKYGGLDTYVILQKIFSDKTALEIRCQLRQHQNWAYVPLFMVQSTLHFLHKEKHFSKQMIFDALPILLYSGDALNRVFEIVVESEAAKRNDPWFLQMALYFLEKPYNFTGNSVFEKPVDLHSPQLEVENLDETIFDHFDKPTN